MNSELEKLEHKSATYSSSEESTSPILVSNVTRKRRSKCSNKYISPENGGFCKKKMRVFDQETTHFLSSSGFSRHSENNKCVRRNLNTFFADVKEKNAEPKVKIESVPECSAQHENIYPQLREMFNTIWGIKSDKSFQNTNERCHSVQKLFNESELCKVDASAVPTSLVCNKKKVNTLIDVSKTSLLEASKNTGAHSPLMEFESPVRSSIKSNLDVEGSPLLFNEFDSNAGHDNENNVTEICTPKTKKYLWSDNTSATSRSKIEEYNTQKLIEQNKFERNLSPVFIDFEMSPVTSKTISPLKSENLGCEGVIPLRRSTSVNDLFNEDEMGVNKEHFVAQFDIINDPHKIPESVTIEDCCSLSVEKQTFKALTSTYEKIEDCSQESYLGGSSQYRNKNESSKLHDIIEYEQTQCEGRTASCDGVNISFHLSPELDTNAQAHCSAKDTQSLQCIEPSEKLCQVASLLDSPCSRRTRKTKPGSLILRLNQLVRRHRSETNIWKHENKYMGISMKSKINLNVLRIINIWKECSRVVLHCCRDVIVNPRETNTCNEDTYMDFKIIIILETSDAQNLVEGSCVRIYPPWQILELEKKRTVIFLCVSKLELLSNSKLLCTKKDMEMVAQDFSYNISQSCPYQGKCSCFSEVKAQCLPIIFRHSPASAERYYSSQVHTVNSSVVNSIMFSEIHVKGCIVYEFRCRNPSDRDRIVSNILAIDSKNEVFQIMLKTESDEHKWKLEKSKHSNILDTCFLFSGLVVSTQLDVHRTCGLPSLLTYLKQTSKRQDYLFVLSASCDWWNVKPCGTCVIPLLQDKIDNNGLLQLCSQVEEIRQNAVVTVLLFTGKKLYFQGNRMKPYGIVCIDDFAVVPKIKCGYIIEICCIKCMLGMFIVDRYSTITVKEDCTKHISFYLISLPCLTMQTELEELVTVKGIIKEINEECYSSSKKSKNIRCQAVCRTSSEKLSSTVAFIKVTELPNECTVKVKGLNRTLCTGSAVSLVCVVVNVLKNECGNAYGFILENV